MTESFFAYVVYDQASDFPGKFVVRRWECWPNEGAEGDLCHSMPDANPLIVADTLNEARSVVPVGLACFPRQALDDSAILETWL